jgi:hypothetical protein
MFRIAPTMQDIRETAFGDIRGVLVVLHPAAAVLGPLLRMLQNLMLALTQMMLALIRV